ncbi:MAG TPA: cytochrome P450 [Candidatus Limnocylindrales bacterium]|nr:cytochrome P450 [Candidatus Limnocylindrales bacterium]
MSEPAFDLDAIDVFSPAHYVAHGYPHAEWKYLRKHSPVHWYEVRADVDPYWVITKHADIVELSKQPEIFQIAPRLAMFPRRTDPPTRPRSLLNMDPPEHGDYRRVSARQFTPRTVTQLAPHVDDMTREVLDAAARKESGDFVADISAPITIGVIADMLGVPAADREKLFHWTNEVIAPEDPEFATGNAGETFEKARIELFTYFKALSDERRRNPATDIVSTVANGTVHGQPLPDFELLSYYMLLVAAGNETTRNAMTGGMIAFLENPGEWEKLRRNPQLLDLAIEEIVRWTTPVIQFARTPTQDYVLRGKTIKAGQPCCLVYPSGNRDEDVFPDGDVFRIDRDPNDHIGFGRGEHVCLGAHLARLELKTAFRHLLERLEHAELAGPVERARSSFVGGIKRAPMRWSIRA